MTSTSTPPAPDTATTDSDDQGRVATFLASADGRLAGLTVLAIGLHLLALFTIADAVTWWVVDLPLMLVVVGGGAPLVLDVFRAVLRWEAGTDLLAAVSIIASIALGEWLVGAIIVLMMSGGEGLEVAASARASQTLDALARRSPSLARRLRGRDLASGSDEIPASEVAVGDRLVVAPHETCPVDGEVVDGHGAMDESYLTGEPYVVPKSVGSQVLSGAINDESALVIVAAARAQDSRYAQIVDVLRDAEQRRPPMRRLADRLGGWYTVLALTLGIVGWVVSGDPERFLAVVVIATPCPLLIGVPVAIIGAISLSAKRGIIVKDPAMLERISRVRTVIFDKTGTLTYGRPALTEVVTATGYEPDDVLADAAAVEQYSRHPLASAVIAEARRRGLPDHAVASVVERPGQGLVGEVDDRRVQLTSRTGLAAIDPDGHARLAATTSGLEAVVALDGRYAATLRFRDEPRMDAARFIAHLPSRHGVARTMLMSGDRESEVAYVAEQVGIDEVHAEVSPEDKLAITRELTAAAPTLFLGDGINDAPAMTAATAGVAFGANSDVTTEAADAVILDSSLERLDDLLHIGERMRRIALQSALGGIALSVVGMGFAVAGLLTPLAGAILQEVIDLAAILNSARVTLARGTLADLHDHPQP